MFRRLPEGGPPWRAYAGCFNKLIEEEEIMKSKAFCLAACLAIGISGTCSAQDLKAQQKFTDTEIGFEITGPYSNLTLTVTGPNGITASAQSRTGSPLIDLRKIGAVDDGEYNYQLTASTDDKIPVRTRLDDGRDGGPTTAMFKNVSTSGHFHVKGGAVVKFDPSVRETQRQQ
jgi:hypothetical protein